MLIEDFVQEDLKSKVIIEHKEEYLNDETKLALREFTTKFTNT